MEINSRSRSSNFENHIRDCVDFGRTAEPTVTGERRQGPVPSFAEVSKKAAPMESARARPSLSETSKEALLARFRSKLKYSSQMLPLIQPRKGCTSESSILGSVNEIFLHICFHKIGVDTAEDEPLKITRDISRLDEDCPFVFSKI